jgi:hypothetical protein
VQPENKFDQLGKRLAVAVSRRSLLRSLSVALAGAVFPWKKIMAQSKGITSAEVESKFFTKPSILELRIDGRLQLRCIATAYALTSGNLSIGQTSSKDGDCPTDVASYFENSDLKPELINDGVFDESQIFNTRMVDGRRYMFDFYPIVSFYSSVNPTTGKEEFEAYCSVATKLDRRVHKGQVDQKVIHYKRKPTPQTLTSFDDEVTCGDINFAYENEIKTRKPIALRDFADGSVPHASSFRLNATDTSAENQSVHKSK